MRAILIDPEKRTIREIQHSGGGYQETNSILGCDTYTTGAWLTGSIEKGFDAVYASDDPIEDADDPGSGFRLTPTATRLRRFPLQDLA
jgi:hypothetical protein